MEGRGQPGHVPMGLAYKGMYLNAHFRHRFAPDGISHKV
jgi:hypothetical protein